MPLRSLARELLPLAITVAIGVGIATIPHWWLRDPEWVADYDELSFYLPVGAASYRDHPWRLTDVTTGGPAYYQPLPIVPGILLAKALDVGPWQVGLCWRVYGAIAIATGWYLLLRCRFRPFISVAVASILMADPGMLNGQLTIGLARALIRCVSFADLPETTPTAVSLTQWRILNPVLTWPWWLAFFALMARAVEVPVRRRIVPAGVACGLLFHVYFYLWTAAIVGLLLALSIDRRKWRVYVGVGLIGIAIGLPALIASAQFRAAHGSDWMHRTDKFLPVGRFEEILLPRVSVVILAVAWVWVWFRNWNLAWLACFATASLLLLNQTVVTGLQIENFHWNYALGPALALLVVLVTADLVARLPERFSRFGPILLGVLALITVLGGGYLFARAASRLPENVRIREAKAAFQTQMSGPSLPEKGSVAADAEFQYLAAIGYDLRPLDAYSAVLSPMSNDELDLRVALNCHLLGWSRERFESDQRNRLIVNRWGTEARSSEAREARLAMRLAKFDAIAANPDEFVDRFDVRVLARSVGEPDRVPPGWVLHNRGARWNVWVRPR